MKLLLLLAALSTAVIAAQQPVYRGDTRLVRLDVSVLDAKKRPVRDLTAADFRVTERGTTLSVRAFEMIEVPAGAGGPGAVEPRPDSSSPNVPAGPGGADGRSTDVTATNPGRLLVLLMDDGMTPTEPRWARQAKNIARAIVQGMGPLDRTAIQFTRAGTTRLELTMDQAALLARIETFDPGGFLALPPTRPSWDDEEPRYWRTMATIENTVEALGSLTDRQKVIAYVGPGIPDDRYDNLIRRRAELFQAAERANVVVYTFDPTGLDTLQGYVYARALLGARMAPRVDGGAAMSQMVASAQAAAARVTRQTAEFVASMAENTGGRALLRTDIFEPAVAQMFADTSLYYLIAVSPRSERPDGRFHEVSVRVNRPDVEVRARRGYYYE